MIAPAAFEDLTFPNQKLNPFSQFESEQWMRAGLQLNTTLCEYGTATRIGSSYGTGVVKWNGAALAANGKIYAPPHVRNDWLIIDTLTDSVTTTGSVNNSNDGAFYDKITNSVYGFGSSGCKINCATDASSNISGPGNRQGGPLQGFDGDKVYTIGSFGTRGVYEYSIQANSATLKQSIGSDRSDTGCLGINGKAYWGTGPNSNFYVYDPVAGTGTTFGTGTADKNNFVIQYFDGYMYSLPTISGTTIVRIDPKTNTTTNVVTGLSATSCGLACIGADGRIYAPNGGNLFWFDPRTNATGNLALGTGDTSFVACMMGAMGDIYVIPNSSAYVNKVALSKGSGYIQKIVQEYNMGGRFFMS